MQCRPALRSLPVFLLSNSVVYACASPVCVNFARAVDQDAVAVPARRPAAAPLRLGRCSPSSFALRATSKAR